MHDLIYSTCARTLAVVQSTFTDDTKYDATHNMFLDQRLAYVPAEAGVHTLKPRKVFTE